MPLLVTGTLQNKKEKPFYPQQIYYSKGFLRRKGEIYNLDIFSEVKAHLTARQVAESYGLHVRRNGTACCPFHDDRHPSMKGIKIITALHVGWAEMRLITRQECMDYPSMMQQRN